MSNACLAWTAVAFALCCLAQPPVPAERATISGIVTNTAGEPLRRVRVQLTPVPFGRGPAADAPAFSSATETDLQGSFIFDGVAPGRYMLIAERTGYLPARYGNMRGGPLAIEPGQRTTDIVIKLLRQGIIAGRVVDDENEPLPGATVSVRLYSAPGQRQPLEPPGSEGTTNADGAFAIGNLIPGKYIVSVAARPTTGPPVKTASTGSRADVYVTTYYPDAADFADATPVELSAGGEVRGLEIRLQRVPVFKVSGRVVNAETGEPGSVNTLQLFRRGSGPPGLSARSTGVRAGEFSFDGVLPGTYILEAKPASAGEDRPAWVGRQVVSVGNGDLDRVVLEMKPGIEARGKVIVEGTPAPSWPQITLTPTEGLNYPGFAMIDEDGSFVLTGLEQAPYRVNIGSIPPPFFVKSVRFNGRELGDEPIDLASALTASLEIVISDRASSSISGVVSELERPVGRGVTVVAIPSRSSGRGPIAQTDENGRFSFAGLPPGEYLLIAMDTAGFPLLPPESLETLGKRVSVTDGESAVAGLKLITPDDLRSADLR